MSDFDVDCPRCKRIKEQLKFAPPPPTPNAPILPDLTPVKATKQITPTQIGCCSLVVLFLLLSGIMCGSCSNTDTKDTPATITTPAQTETQPAQTYTPPAQTYTPPIQTETQPAQTYTPPIQTETPSALTQPNTTYNTTGHTNICKKCGDGPYQSSTGKWHSSLECATRGSR